MIEFFEFDLARNIYRTIIGAQNTYYPDDSVFGIPRKEYENIIKFAKRLEDYVRYNKMLKIIVINGWDVSTYFIKNTDIENLKSCVEQNMEFMEYVRIHIMNIVVNR